MFYIKSFILMYFTTVCFGKNYTKYSVYRVTPENEQHLHYLEDLDEKYDVNFWKYPGLIKMPVEFSISPKHKEWFLKDTEKLNLTSKILHEDLQSLIEEQVVRSYSRRTDTFDWEHYYKLQDIYNWLEDLALDNKQYVKVYDIGHTIFKRPIKAVEIKFNKNNNPKIIIEAGIHAREWISTAFATYLINFVLEANKGSDKIWKTIVNSLNWYIIPTINPDGYAYTHQKDGDRMWRKNRRQPFGVDLNRNFAYHFKNVDKPKSESFEGYEAFSEKESIAMANFVKENSNKLLYYMAFHAYGQYIVIPYGDSKVHKENFHEVKSLTNGMISLIEKRYGTKYVSGTAYDCVGYTVTGGSADWVKGSYKIPYALYYELRDTGDDGFVLKPHKIIPTSKELMDGLKYVFEKTLFRKKLSMPNDAELKKISMFCIIVVWVFCMDFFDICL